MVQLKPGQSLYEALGVEKDADGAAIRKAYLKLAVQLHPDKNPNDADAKERFQTLQKVYAVLSDPEKRKVYDRTGSLEDTEALSGEQFDSLYNFYRSVYAPVSEADIDAFAASYRGGAEEAADLLRYYAQFEGDMARVFDWVMLSDPDRDSHRFMDAVDAAIEAGEAERYSRYATWAARVAKRPRPEPEKEGPKKGKGGKGKGAKKKGDDESALVAAIAARRQGAFQSTLASLAAKYGDGEETPPEPTDEEFEAARARIEARNKRAAAGGGGGGKKKAKI